MITTRLALAAAILCSSLALYAVDPNKQPHEGASEQRAECNAARQAYAASIAKLDDLCRRNQTQVPADSNARQPKASDGWKGAYIEFIKARDKYRALGCTRLRNSAPVPESRYDNQEKMPSFCMPER